MLNGKNLNDLLRSPLSDLQNHLKMIRSPVIEMQKIIGHTLDLQSAIARPFQGLTDSLNRFSALFESIESSSTKFTAYQGYSKILSDAIEVAFSPLQIRLQALPEEIQNSVILLAENGWYLDLEMSLPQLFELTQMASNGALDEFKRALNEHFEYRIDEIEVFLVSEFPKRERIFTSAFAAHRRGEYELSVPVFIAQADGICFELIKKSIFRKENKRPATAGYVDQIEEDTIKFALLTPLARIIPILASGNERQHGFSELNRHMVLHGESTDYGTKENSLKSIALVNYLSQAITPS